MGNSNSIFAHVCSGLGDCKGQELELIEEQIFVIDIVDYHKPFALVSPTQLVFNELHQVCIFAFSAWYIAYGSKYFVAFLEPCFGPCVNPENGRLR